MLYTVSVSNCKNPHIECKYEGLGLFLALSVAEILGEAFRSIEVMNEETGELVYHCYYSDEVFLRRRTEGQAIERANYAIASH